jgi:hypothetical protein
MIAFYIRQPVATPITRIRTRPLRLHRRLGCLQLPAGLWHTEAHMCIRPIGCICEAARARDGCSVAGGEWRIVAAFDLPRWSRVSMAAFVAVGEFQTFWACVVPVPIGLPFVSPILLLLLLTTFLSPPLHTLPLCPPITNSYRPGPGSCSLLKRVRTSPGDVCGWPPLLPLCSLLLPN